MRQAAGRCVRLQLCGLASLHASLRATHCRCAGGWQRAAGKQTQRTCGVHSLGGPFACAGALGLLFRVLFGLAQPRMHASRRCLVLWLSSACRSRLHQCLQLWGAHPGAGRQLHGAGEAKARTFGAVYSRGRAVRLTHQQGVRQPGWSIELALHSSWSPSGVCGPPDPG